MANKRSDDKWSGRVLLSCEFEVRIDEADGAMTQKEAELIAETWLRMSICDAAKSSKWRMTRELLGNSGDIEVEEVESDAVDRA